MQKNAFSKKLMAGGAVLLSLSAVQVTQAQLLQLDSGGIAVADGAAVTTWTDTGSGTALNLTGAGSTAPTYHSDFVNNSTSSGYVSFDGGDSLSRGSVLGSDLFGATDATILLVIRPTGANNASSILGWNSGVEGSPGSENFQAAQNTPGSGPFAGVRQLAFNHGTGSYAVTEPSTFANTWLLLTLTRSGNSGEIRVNGQSLGINPTAFQGSSANTGLSGSLFIGSNVYGGQLFTGDIAEIQVYNNVPVNLGTLEANLISDYNLAPVPEPSQYATVFSLICAAGALVYRQRRQRALAS